jgi:alanine-glyoxylate transaminase/(R)-3-amino-2-methylpropionate-pyruvate transaminase
MWGFESHGVVPDIVVMAKGIGNGIPLGAVVARREVAEHMAGKFIFHTYGANPMACAAGRAVLRVIREDNMIDNAARVGAALKSVMEDLKQRHPIIGDVRGRGFMMAIEMVKDRRTREPAPEATAEIFEQTREAGLVMSKSGTYRNVLRMTPPLCVQMADVPVIAEALDRAFTTALA